MCENCSVADQIWQKDNQISELKKDSFHGGFMTRELPNNIFPKRGQGIYAFRPYPIYGDEDIHTKVAEKVSAAEYAKLSSVNVNSPKEDIVEFINILQRLLVQGVFDPVKADPNNVGAQYNANPFGGYSTPAPAPMWGGFGGIQPLYGAPVNPDMDLALNHASTFDVAVPKSKSVDDLIDGIVGVSDATKAEATGKRGRKKKTNKTEADALGNAVLDSIFGLTSKSNNEETKPVSLSNYFDFGSEGDNK